MSTFESSTVKHLNQLKPLITLKTTVKTVKSLTVLSKPQLPCRTCVENGNYKTHK